MGKRGRIFKKLLKYRIIPPKEWRPAVVVLTGMLVGLGIYIVKISNAASYISDDPQVCINCHVMVPHYITWTNSSHREVAHCNDCHVPQDNFFNKYKTKAMDGLYHSTIFTLRMEPEVIQARDASVRVIQNNCIRCHQDQLVVPPYEDRVENHHHHRLDRVCWECHTEVPHGRVKSLSSVGHQIEPVRVRPRPDEDVVPAWLRETLEREKQE